MARPSLHFASTWGLLVLLLYCSGSTLEVPEEFATITEAMSVAAVGDTIEVACGTHFVSGLSMRQGIVLRSETGDPACCVVKPIGETPLFSLFAYSYSTWIEGMTFQGGKATTGGCGFVSATVPVTFKNCRFEGNTCSNFGGAFYLIGPGGTHFEGCRFSGGAARLGGAIYSFNAAVVLRDCTIESNAATKFGGGIYAYGGSLEIHESLVESNESPIGGGIYGRGASVEIADATFRLNQGGALRTVDGGELTCDRTRFESNATDQDAVPQEGGGAIFASDAATLRVMNCQFLANDSEIGGAIATNQVEAIVFESCDFASNTSTVGGGVHIVSTPQVALNECSFIENVAPNAAGLYLNGSSANLDRCLFSGNIAKHVRGGALFGFMSTLAICRSTFVNCSAPEGGAAIAIGGKVASATIDRTLIAFNHGGSAVTSLAGATCFISCSDVFGNEGGDFVDALAGQETMNANFSLDPLFCGIAPDVFGLNPQSPCAPPGVTGCGLVGAFEVACGVVSVRNSSWAAIKALYR